MENIRNSIALKIRARNSLLFDGSLYPELYPPKKEMIDSIEEDIKSLQELLTKKTQKNQKYENFINILKRKKGIANLIDRIKTISSKKIPCYGDIHDYLNIIEYAEKAGLIYRLKEGNRWELYLSLTAERFDFKTLQFYRTATAYLSLSDKYFKTTEAALMSLKPQIKPTLEGIKKSLLRLNESEVYTIRNVESLASKSLVFRLTEEGEIRRKNIISLAKMCGLLESDLVDVISSFPFRGDWVLDHGENSHFFFSESLTKALVKQYRTEHKILPNPILETKSSEDMRRLTIRVKKYSVSPMCPLTITNPLAITDKGKNYLEQNSEYFFNVLLNNHNNSFNKGKNLMNRYLRILWLLHDYDPLSILDIYKNFNLSIYSGRFGLVSVISKMFKKNLIGYKT